MCRPRVRLITVRSLALLAASAGLVLTTATPAAAHSVSGGDLPAPPWLLSYLGAFAVLATALALRSAWPRARLRRFAGATAAEPVAPGPGSPGPVTSVHAPGAEREPLGVHVGHLVGVVLYGLVLAAAIIGPDNPAANIAPVAVLVVWWVGLPILCLLAGDVMALVNPFVAVVRVLERGRTQREGRDGPAWVPAAFIAAFGWFFVAYHRPGSPRAVAVFLVVYALAAIAAGLRWGSRWLATGEGFGALSASVGRLCPWLRSHAPVPGTAAVMVVWVGATAFDGFSSTPFWEDVAGASTGWDRTVRNTLGFAWLTAIVGGVYLAALWLAERRAPQPPDDAGGESALAGRAATVGIALVPLAVGWFLAHDLTLLIFEGQNFLALLSDPVGRGWDLLGTIDITVDYGLTEAWWVSWTQVLALALGHVAAVVIVHDTALHQLRRRPAMVVTWCFTAAAVASIVAAALLVLG